MMNDKFIDIIKKKVDLKELKTKEEIIDYIKKIQKLVYNDLELMQMLKELGINLEEQNLNKVTEIILDYYDKKNVNTTSLNLDGVSQFEIKDEKGFDDRYIKIDNQDGTYTILEDNMTDKDFVTQFNEKQNASVDLQTNDGVKNKEEIIKDMKDYDKIEVNLQSTNDIDTRELTKEEKAEFATVMQGKMASEINFVVDTKRNMYIDKDTGETYYTYLNSDNKMELRKVNEQKSETISRDVLHVDENGIKENITVETPSNIDFNDLDDYDLKYVLDNKFDTLTEDQKQTLFTILKRREEMKNNSQDKDMNKEKGYQYILNLNKPVEHNGYLNILFLSLVTLLFGIGYILMLSFMI